MEREGRRREEGDYFVCITYEVIDKALKSFFKCLGLHDSSPPPSAPGFENHSEETVILEVTSRKIKVKPKDQNKQKPTKGKPGGTS